MDGNYGLMAAIPELLVQSHGGVVRILPALPAAWPAGSVRGLRCRGGLAVDIDWENGQLAKLVVRRISGDPAEWVQISYGGRDLRTTIADAEVFAC
jgi:alpha-L-fucosidase 2